MTHIIMIHSIAHHHILVTMEVIADTTLLVTIMDIIMGFQMATILGIPILNLKIEAVEA